MSVLRALGLDRNSNNERTRKQHRKSLQKRRLLLESLQTRQLMAADVQIVDDAYTPVTRANSIEQAAEFDLYRVEAAEGQTITASTAAPSSGSGMDTYMRLFDANGQELARNDDGGPGLYSHIEHEAPSSGHFYIGVSGYGNSYYDMNDADSGSSRGRTGNYQLTLDVDAEAVEVNNADSGYSTTGTISNDSQFDLYRVEAIAGHVLNIETSASGSGMDTYLRLFDANGQELTRNDDGGAGLYSRIAYEVSTDGTYYIAVSGYGNSSFDMNDPESGSGRGRMGEYRLTVGLQGQQAVEQVLVEVANPAGGFTATGRIQTGSQFDLYHLHASAGDTIDVSTSAHGSGMDTYLRLFDHNGQQVARNDDGGAGLYSHITHQVTESGTYYIGVSGYGNSSYAMDHPETGSSRGRTGDYRVNVALEQANHAPQWDTLSNIVVNEDTAGRFDISASDQDGDGLTLSVTGLPSFATFTDHGNGAGTITYDADFDDSGTYSLTFAASDGQETTTRTINLTVNNVNRAPVVEVIGNQFATPDSGAIEVTLQGSDADRDEVNYTTIVGRWGGWVGSSGSWNDSQTVFEMSGGRFEKIEEGQWTEFRNNGPSSHYQQIGQSEAGVVLYDAGRDLYIRVGETLAEGHGPSSNSSIATTQVTNGNQLRITPAAGFTGDFNVIILASDGEATVRSSFEVTIGDLQAGADRYEVDADGSIVWLGTNRHLRRYTAGGQLLQQFGEDVVGFELRENIGLLFATADHTIHWQKSTGEEVTRDAQGGWVQLGDTLYVAGYHNEDDDIRILNPNTINRSIGETIIRPAADVSRIVVHGYGGDDTITNETQLPLIAFGGSGDDYIYGSSGNDYLDGGADDDRIWGASGDDTILGGNGDDRLYGEGHHDYLFGGAGNDQLVGGYGHDFLFGGDNDDKLYGSDGRDRLFGQMGADRLVGGLGVDFLREDHLDTIVFDDGRVVGASDLNAPPPAGFYATDDGEYGPITREEAISNGYGEGKVYDERTDSYIDPPRVNEVVDIAVDVCGAHLTDGLCSPDDHGAYLTDVVNPLALVAQGTGDTHAIDANDVIQPGYLGSCTFSSVLAAEARVNPNGLMQGIRYHYTEGHLHYYTVRLYDQAGDEMWVPVALNSYIPNIDAGRADGEIWSMLYHRAYLQTFATDDSGNFITNGNGSLAEGQFQNGVFAMRALTGRAAQFVSSTSQTDLAMALSTSRVVAHSRGDAPTGLDANGIYAYHSYTVLGMSGSGSNAQIRLRNPHGGVNAELTITWNQFVQSFQGFTKSL